MSPPIRSEADLLLRIQFLQKIMAEAQEVTEAKEANRWDVLRTLNRLTNDLAPIEKYAPEGAASQEAIQFWNDNALATVISANHIKSDLNTLLKIIKESQADNNEQLSVADVTEGLAHIPLHQSTPAAPPLAMKRSANYLPKHLEVKLPTFSGNYAEYSSFRSAFDEYTRHEGASPALKFLVLQAHLKDQAQLFVQGLNPTPENLEKALKAMDDFYNQPQRVIDALEMKLYELPPAEDNAKSLRSTYLQLECIFNALEQNGIEVDRDDKYRKYALVKYPERIRSSISPTQVVTMHHLRRTMVAVIDQKQDLESAFSSVMLGASMTPTEQKEVLAFASMGTKMKMENPKENKDRKEKTHPKCTFCSSDHYSTDCKKFSTAEERKKSLPEDSCISCLRTGHTSRSCRTRFSCYYCKRKGHHSALCYQKFPSAEKAKTAKPETKEKAQEERSTNLALHEKGLLLTAKTIIQNPDTGARLKARIFLDPGADGSYILERERRILRLPTIGTKNLKVSVFLNSAAQHLKTETVKLQVLSNIDPKFQLDVIADTVTHLPFINTFDVQEFQQAYPIHNDLAYADAGNEEEVTVMLGIDYFWDVIKTQSVIHVDQGLFLVNSAFGWLVSGRVNDASSNRSTNTACTSIQSTISNLWSIESLGISDPNLSKDREEEIALESFTNSIAINEEEHRFEVKWPWKEFPPPLPSNYALAHGIVRNLHRRTRPEHLQLINETFDKQLKSNIIEEVVDPLPHTSRTHYLPYHLVIRDKNTPTPVRIVYNGSAKSKSSNLSLNDCLYKGINLLPALLNILLRVRFGTIVLVADVEKAFHQILLKSSERDFLRFLAIRTDEGSNEKLVTYRFRRVPFGIISSPFMLAGVIHHLLNASKNNFAEIIKENLYVDNLIITSDELAAALKLQDFAIKIFDSVSMNLRMWNSNVQRIKNAVPPERRDEEKVISILGVEWDIEHDTLSCAAPDPITKELKHTMRTVLKASAQAFDPMGFFCPVTIRAKVLMRDLHERNAKWDDTLTESESGCWNKILDDLIAIPKVKIPRMISRWPQKPDNCEVHVFSDASKNAFAAVAYIRISNESSTTTRLLFAKARLAPVKRKELTIPKLELMGSVISARSIRQLRNALPFLETARTFLWIDSKCVLSWLTNNATQTTFVRNRIREIHEVHNVTYRYVPSKENIADLPTRFTTLEELSSNKTWWNGPTFLSQPPSCWPAANTFQDTHPADQELETKRAVVNVVNKVALCTPFGLNLSKFNSYRKLLKVTAYCIKFIRLRSEKFRLKFTRNDFELAMHLWIQDAQITAYTSVRDEAESNKLKSQFAKRVRPFLDEIGLLRFGGRFERATVSEYAKHPIILPKPTDNRFVHLLTLYVHESMKHAGVLTTLTAIQRKYWFPQGRRQVHSTIIKCVPCARETAQPYHQPMTSILPDFRLKSGVTPFLYSGIDICGPFVVLKQKVWIFMSTCLVMRGIALEVLDCMETAHIFDAMRRIAARRTWPQFLLSDNAPQFILLRSYLLKNSAEPLEWKSIPQYSPWQGGVYERLIAIIKTSLYRCLQQTTKIGPTQFKTIVAEIEYTINSRPLAEVTAAPENKVITPNDILQVQGLPIPFDSMPTSDSKAAKNLAEMSRNSTELVQQFWADWRTVYLNHIRERPSTQSFQRRSSKHDPKVNDVVIIKDALRKRAAWRLGRISKLIKSADDVVRSAKVKNGNGHFTVHPLKDLYLLEIQNSLPLISAPISTEAVQDDNVDVEVLGLDDIPI